VVTRLWHSSSMPFAMWLRGIQHKVKFAADHPMVGTANCHPEIARPKPHVRVLLRVVKKRATFAVVEGVSSESRLFRNGCSARSTNGDPIARHRIQHRLGGTPSGKTSAESESHHRTESVRSRRH
jgi:hypothetical protein